MRFTGRLQAIKVDTKFTKTLDEALQRQNREAARAWLRAVITRVSVWSGESMGSIKFASGPNGFLGEYLNVAIPINPVEHRLGKDEQTGGRQARYNFRTSNHVYGFYFRTDVIQYELYEFYRMQHSRKPSPWNSLKVGSAAYRAYIRENLPRLPKIQDALIKTFIELD